MDSSPEGYDFGQLPTKINLVLRVSDTSLTRDLEVFVEVASCGGECSLQEGEKCWGGARFSMLLCCTLWVSKGSFTSENPEEGVQRPNSYEALHLGKEECKLWTVLKTLIWFHLEPLPR